MAAVLRRKVNSDEGPVAMATQSSAPLKCALGGSSFVIEPRVKTASAHFLPILLTRFSVTISSPL